jgi:hypothetical protein
MPGSPTAPGQPGAGESAPGHVAFHQQNCVGTRVDADFAAQWLAYALPDRRFARTLADADARLGAGVDRYSFTAVDLHHLLLAGLPALSACRPTRSEEPKGVMSALGELGNDANRPTWAQSRPASSRHEWSTSEGR